LEKHGTFYLHPLHYFQNAQSYFAIAVSYAHVKVAALCAYNCYGIDTCSPALVAMLENPKAPPSLDCQMALLLARCMNW